MKQFRYWRKEKKNNWLKTTDFIQRLFMLCLFIYFSFSKTDEKWVEPNHKNMCYVLSILAFNLCLDVYPKEKVSANPLRMPSFEWFHLLTHMHFRYLILFFDPFELFLSFNTLESSEWTTPHQIWTHYFHSDCTFSEHSNGILLFHFRLWRFYCVCL